MSFFITIIHIIVCFMLIAVILLQAGRGQGLAGASFGGGNVQSLFGTKGSVFLQKATTAAAVLFMLTCISLDIIEARRSRSLLEAGRSAAPMDMDQIRRALEKVRQEAEMQGAAVDPLKVSDQAAEGFLEQAGFDSEDHSLAAQVPAVREELAGTGGDDAGPVLPVPRGE